MTLDVTIAGDNCRLVLSVYGYEFGDESKVDYDDANWLLGHVELAAGRTGRFSARHEVSFRTTELARFRDDLRGITERLAGEATLDHMEDQVGCVVRIESGKGDMTVFVREHIGAALRVDEIQTDQSYIAQSLRELDTVLEAFPVRMGRGSADR